MPTRLVYTSMSNVTISRVKKDDATNGLISAQEGFARRDLLFCAFFGGHRFILPWPAARTAPTHSRSLSLSTSQVQVRGAGRLSPYDGTLGCVVVLVKGFCSSCPILKRARMRVQKSNFLKWTYAANGIAAAVTVCLLSICGIWHCKTG